MTDITAPELIQLDPRSIATEKLNVRKDPNLTAQFVDSIRTHGVETFPTVYWVPAIDGYQVKDGQRRVLAAVEAGLTEIYVVVVDAPTDDAARIVDQLVVNEQRSSITPGEDAGAIADLALFGVPASMIAKRVGRKMKAVSAAVKVAGSPIASAALQQHQLSIDEAFVLIEFENDQAAVALLQETLASRPGQLAHVAQRIRNDRRDAAARQIIADQIAAAGLTLIDKPGYYDTDARRVSNIYLDPNHDEVLPPETALAEAGDDLRGYVHTHYEWTGDVRSEDHVIGYAVANWEAHGWFSVSAGNSTPEAAPLTEEEQIARAAQEKIARAESRANTKEWTAARGVRLRYVKELLKRRGLPTDYVALPALWFAGSGGDKPYRSKAIIAELLGVEVGGYGNETVAKLLTDSPGQAAHIMLAIGVGCLEASWDEKKGWASNDLKMTLYLRQLQSWGYELSDIEETIVNPPAVPLIDDEVA